jgi:hypothetical protein
MSCAKSWKIKNEVLSKKYFLKEVLNFLMCFSRSPYHFERNAFFILDLCTHE